MRTSEIVKHYASTLNKAWHLSMGLALPSSKPYRAITALEDGLLVFHERSSRLLGSEGVTVDNLRDPEAVNAVLGSIISRGAEVLGDVIRGA